MSKLKGDQFQSRYQLLGHKPPKRPNEPSRTKQEFLAESDINTMMAKYERVGLAPPSGTRQPIFGDFTDPAIGDYQAAMQQVQGVRDLMDRLPAKVRDRFANDPVKLLQFVQNKDNAQEAYELGLMRPDYKSPSTPPETPPTTPGKAS